MVNIYLSNMVLPVFAVITNFYNEKWSWICDMYVKKYHKIISYTWAIWNVEKLVWHFIM